jgi:hypothetical protein
MSGKPTLEMLRKATTGKPTLEIETDIGPVSIMINIQRESNDYCWNDFGQLLEDIQTFMDAVSRNCVIADLTVFERPSDANEVQR